MSLYRLIDLAKRTGDRLIVHNPIDETDVVMMSVEQYEDLLGGFGTGNAAPPTPGPVDNGPMPTAGEILSDRYDAAEYFSFGDEISGTPAPIEENFHIPDEHIEDYEQIMAGVEETVEDEPVVEDIASAIPKGEGAVGAQWEEEPLDNDEPVFYEEPV